MNSRLPVLCILSAGLGLLSSCNLPAPQEDTTRYFTLSGPATGPAAPDGAAVRPVRLAGHLRNREMAVRVSDHEVVYLDEVRWAEPLDDAITQILRQRLRQVAGDVVISVQVQRCELVRNADNAVQVAATYSIVPVGGDARTGVFSSTPRKWDGKDYGALVGLLREGVEELAETVAQAAAKK